MNVSSLQGLRSRFSPCAFRIFVFFWLCSALLVSTETSVDGRQSRELQAGHCRKEWLSQGMLGLSTHYFALNTTEKEKLAAEFQSEVVAQQAAEAGASWFLFTLHHQPWIMMAPNETYTRILGTNDFTTKRDVPLELQRQLGKRGIKLMLYVNLRLDPASACPANVRKAMGGWPPNDRLIENVAAVYREFSLRYGSKIAGWWVDGVQLPEYGKSSERERWFKTLADALHAGNPDALVAFNPGLRWFARYTQQDDYIAGESMELSPVPSGRCVDGAQWHLWTYLGGWWSSGGTRFSDKELRRFVSAVSARGGAVTFEVGTRGLTREGQYGRPMPTPFVGYVDPSQIEQIKRINLYRIPSPSGRGKRP